GALGNLPVPVLGIGTEFVDSNGHAIEVEIGELAVAFRSQADPAPGGKGEQVHELRVVGVVDAEGKGSVGDHRVNHRFGIVIANFPHDGRIHVAMEETRNVIAIINADELAAERIAIAVLNQNKLAGKAAVCIEIHGDVFAVKRKPAECYS